MFSIDEQIRAYAFDWLKRQAQLNDGVFLRGVLQKGFIFQNERIPLVSPQGIFKPKWMDFPLTITTTLNGPYDDFLLHENDFLEYKYRGNEKDHRDNVGLRECMKREIPLIYFHSFAVGKYLAFWPVFIIGDNPDSLSFSVALDDYNTLKEQNNIIKEPDARRLYLTSTIRTRLNQQGFRERILKAYRSQCSLCRLKHIELLDAAHIIPYGDPSSSSSVNNGLALCKLHHAAYDKNIIGINPDYEIEVRDDILEEEDGPILKHGLQKLSKSKLILPRKQTDWPNRDFLNIRYIEFLK